jgi:hypothetical protein
MSNVLLDGTAASELELMGKAIDDLRVSLLRGMSDPPVEDASLVEEIEALYEGLKASFEPEGKPVGRIHTIYVLRKLLSQCLFALSRDLQLAKDMQAVRTGRKKHKSDIERVVVNYLERPVGRHLREFNLLPEESPKSNSQGRRSF